MHRTHKKSYPQLPRTTDFLMTLMNFPHSLGNNRDCACEYSIVGIVYVKRANHYKQQEGVEHLNEDLGPNRFSGVVTKKRGVNTDICFVF